MTNSNPDSLGWTQSDYERALKNNPDCLLLAASLLHDLCGALRFPPLYSTKLVAFNLYSTVGEPLPHQISELVRNKDKAGLAELYTGVRIRDALQEKMEERGWDLAVLLMRIEGSATERCRAVGQPGYSSPLYLEVELGFKNQHVTLKKEPGDANENIIAEDQYSETEKPDTIATDLLESMAKEKEILSTQ